MIFFSNFFINHDARPHFIFFSLHLNSLFNEKFKLIQNASSLQVYFMGQSSLPATSLFSLNCLGADLWIDM